LTYNRDNKRRLKTIFKAQKAKQQEEREIEEQFYKNYEPLASALGPVSSEVKQNMRKNSHKLLGPGRFDMEQISHRNWLQKMSAPLNKDEDAFMDKLEEENEMDMSEVSMKDTDDEIMSH
jgi:hypothetical protein